MAKPAHTSDAMYNFWLRFKKKEPAVRLGGTYANKPGYHNTRNNNPSGDYSEQLANDRLGSGDLCAAIDLTMPAAQMKKYSARLLKSGRDMKDPRGNYLREFYGTLNGRTVVGWDFQAVTSSSSDSSHLWHIHVSVLRRYAADAKAFDALYSILVGESVTAWKVRNKVKEVAKKVVKKPAPKPTPKIYVSVKAGDNLTKIASRYHTTVARLLALNPLKRKHPDDLNIGEKIRVK